MIKSRGRRLSAQPPRFYIIMRLIYLTMVLTDWLPATTT